MKQQTAGETGLTRDTGWQIGVRRTLPVPVNKLWDFMVSSRGVNIWLGEGPDFPFIAGEKYSLADGTTGMIRVLQPESHWRITRDPPDPGYQRPSLIQIRTISSGDKSVLVFHEEHLPSGEERERRKTYYLKVLEMIRQELGLV